MLKNNLDPKEIAQFEAVADTWWDKNGAFRALHNINPVRFEWIRRHSSVTEGWQVLDVGCGGGLLTEALAQTKATVTGIDARASTLEISKTHSETQGLSIQYLHKTAEEMAADQPQHFDLVTCMELLEHVPEPASLVQACARLTKPGGHLVFSTINRNLQSWLTAIVAAEHVLGLLPKGTHEYEKLIRPSELGAFCRAAGLRVQHIQGLVYNPLTHKGRLTRSVQVNYMMHCSKPKPAHGA